MQCQQCQLGRGTGAYRVYRGLQGVQGVDAAVRGIMGSSRLISAPKNAFANTFWFAVKEQTWIGNSKDIMQGVGEQGGGEGVTTWHNVTACAEKMLHRTAPRLVPLQMTNNFCSFIENVWLELSRNLVRYVCLCLCTSIFISALLPAGHYGIYMCFGQD